MLKRRIMQRAAWVAVSSTSSFWSSVKRMGAYQRPDETA